MNREPEPEFMDIDEEAQAYAEADFREVNTAFVERLLEVVGPIRRPKVLDLGTGPGVIPIQVHHSRPDWQISAVDASVPMLRLAREILAKAGIVNGLFLCAGDAKRLPFDSGCFNVIFSNSILHHIEWVTAFWAEVRRVAAPGAVLFLRDLTRPATHEAAWQLVNRYAGGESGLLREEFLRSLFAAYTPEEVRTQLIAAGLSMLGVAQVTDRHLDVAGWLTRRSRRP